MGTGYRLAYRPRGAVDEVASVYPSLELACVSAEAAIPRVPTWAPPSPDAEHDVLLVAEDGGGGRWEIRRVEVAP